MSLDEAQLRALYQSHGPMVLRRAQRILGDAADAEEALQEVFVRAFRGADGFDGRASVATWLYRITTHWCLNRLRDRRRRQALWDEKVAPAKARASASVDHLEAVALRRVLAEADEREAKAALCVLVDGMSHDEAAKVLGVSRRTVGNLVERFTAFARKRLGDKPR